MKTNQIIESCENRTLKAGGVSVVIRQRTKDSYFSLQDISRVVNLIRIAELGNPNVVRIDKYFELDSTKAFINAIKAKKGVEAYIRQRGRGKESWVHPHLFLDILLWANPEFKLEIYDWLFDYLVKYRIDSGDSFNIMKGALHTHSRQKHLFQKAIKGVCQNIKKLIGVEDWNKASQEQLRRRDELQKMIADLAETTRNSKIAVELGFANYRRKYLGENTQILL